MSDETETPDPTPPDPWITVTERTADYHACIKGRPEIWGAGKSPAEAIGSLVSAHQEHFGVAGIEWPKVRKR